MNNPPYVHRISVAILKRLTVLMRIVWMNLCLASLWCKSITCNTFGIVFELCICGREFTDSIPRSRYERLRVISNCNYWIGGLSVRMNRKNVIILSFVYFHFISLSWQKKTIFTRTNTNTKQKSTTNVDHLKRFTFTLKPSIKQMVIVNYSPLSYKAWGIAILH